MSATYEIKSLEGKSEISQQIWGNFGLLQVCHSHKVDLTPLFSVYVCTLSGVADL